MVTLAALLVASMLLPFQGPSISPRDSTRALRRARNAQGDFESMRRRLLPFQSVNGGGGCEDVVGRYCYKRQFTTPPEESPQVVDARMRLLATLDSVGALIPNDQWILGQRVRYLMEARRPRAADSLGVACAARNSATAASSWCLALIGYTAQQQGDYPRADAAFTSALAAMPASERCKWEDIALFLGRSAAGPYRRVDCQLRDSVTAGFWRLVQPLYLKSVNDLRTELLARVTRMYIEQGTRTPMSDWWGPDDRTTLIRYGVPLWYTRGEVSRQDMRASIAGFRREPTFNFFPDAHVFAEPDQLSPADWNLAFAYDEPTYAPLWAINFQPITDYQVALFRRGDSAVVIAAFDADDGADTSDTRQAGAFAAMVDRGGVLEPFGTTIARAGRDVVATIMAPWRPLIVSLEVLNPTRGLAGRARFAPRLPAAGARLGLSDLLLYAPRDSVPASLGDAVRRVLHDMRVPSNRQVGIFWEAYGVRSQGEPLDYALLVEPEDESLLHRALVKLHAAEPDKSVALRWHEAATATDGIVSRGMTVDLSRLRPGRYSVRLMVTSGTDLPIVAERSIEILRHIDSDLR